MFRVPLIMLIVNSFEFAGFSRGLTDIGSKYLALSKAGQRFRAKGIFMPHLTQGPVVSGNVKMTLYTFKKIDATNNFIFKLHHSR